VSAVLKYVVLGAGRQGRAAAWDLARHGDAGEVVLADVDENLAVQAARQIAPRDAPVRVTSARGDASRPESLVDLLRGADAVLSAVPWRLNPGVARAAIAEKTSFCDLGGNTDATRQVLALDALARAAEVSLIPDCGLAPGMCNTLAVHAMGLIDRPREVRMFCGGLPQNPRGELRYSLLFSIEGLTTEYNGLAMVLRDGKIARVPALHETEEFDHPELGRLEAFVTSGGTSTACETFLGKLDRYEYKTVRYPGHSSCMRAIAELGLFDLEPVSVDGARVRPRDLFHAVAARRLDHGRVRDLVILRVQCQGEHRGKPALVRIDLCDRFDEATGFSAMERTTGFAAAIVCAMLARREVSPGAQPLETAIDAGKFVAELHRRGLAPRVTGP
jgi:lysine 6-dehydrogenase